MEHVTIPLSASHRAFLEEQVADGAFASVAEYLAKLIEADAQGRDRAQAALEALLLEGLADQAAEWTADDALALRRLATTGD